jgi:enoyl-CoA hydratase/carnithine racemase
MTFLALDVLTGGRGGLGVSYLVAPERVAVTIGGHRMPGVAVRLVRLVGMRHVAEAALLGATNSARLARLVGGVDVCHALTMVAVAVAAPRFRRLALAGLAEALALGLPTIAMARSWENGKR